MSTINNSTSTTTTDAAAQFKTQEIRSTALVFHVNLFIWAAIALLVLFRLPHLVGLFGTPSEWYNGFLLRYSPFKGSRSKIARNDSQRTVVGGEHLTEESHTLHSHKRHHKPRRVDEKGAPIEMRYPPHVPVVPKFLRTVLGLLRVRVLPNYSAAQILLLSTYFYALLYATLYKSNPLVDATRPAWVAVSQLPLLFALAQKNNILGSLLGYGYEKLNFIHRFIGQLIVLGGNLHALVYFYKWAAAGTFKNAIARPQNAWGMVALVCFDLIFIFSTSFWRNKAYNVFRWVHTIGMFVLLPAIHFHHPSMTPYILACTAIYGFDRLMRLVKSRITTTTIIPLTQLDMTHIEIPYVNVGWRAGQHVRIRVLSSRMGWFGWAESHPFTIASVSGSQEGMVLMCKQSGTWTRRLGQTAKESGYVENASRVKVWVEGPYGGPGRMMFASFSSAVLVVGGSGITFGLSMLQDLVAKDLKGESRLKYIELIWVIQDPGSLMPLVPLFTSLIQQSVFTPLKISVFYTRAPTSKLPFHASSDSPHSPISIYPNFTLAPGRPRLGKSLDTAISRAVTLGSGVKDSEGITGLAVGVCGPAGLGEDVTKAVAAVDPARRDQVNGIEIHEETFGW